MTFTSVMVLMTALNWNDTCAMHQRRFVILFFFWSWRLADSQKPTTTWNASLEWGCLEYGAICLLAPSIDGCPWCWCFGFFLVLNSETDT